MLRRVFEKVTQKLEAQSVAGNMFQCQAITQKELQSIHSKRSKPIKAAERLLKIVMKQSVDVFNRFLNALKETEQQHVCDIIRPTGRCQGTNNDIIRNIILVIICLHPSNVLTSYSWLGASSVN